MRAASTLIFSYFPLIIRSGAERIYIQNGKICEFIEEGGDKS